MNSSIPALLTILCLLFTVSLTGYQIHVKASSNVIHVPTDFPTIQEAINNAADGDIIFVQNGTYHEQIIANKSVSLIGESAYFTILDGDGSGSVISVEADNVSVKGFTIRNSGPTDSDSGIYITSSGNNISHNIITNNRNGLCLHYSSNNVVFNNNILNNSLHGVLLYYSSNNFISGNNLHTNYNGIYLYYSNYNVISGNNASNNDCGIWICQLSSHNMISDNNIYSNNNGISLYYSGENTIYHNNVYTNYNGIYLYYSCKSIISDNNIYSNNNGISLYYSSNENTIYHNNFINNTNQVWSDSLNAWDNGKEGNYWTDYAGKDLNKDGIGDTPYVIDANNQDNYPLMGTFSDFKVAWKEKIYHITTICNSTISNFKFQVSKETGNKIITFSVTGKDETAGFCRIATPTNLMNYSYIVLIDEEETVPTILNVSDTTHVYLYFTYTHTSHTITIISSKLFYLYNELLDKYTKLHTDFDGLNSTYNELLKSHNTLLENYSQLLQIYNSLNTAHQELEENYSRLLERYHTLNLTTHELLNQYGMLLNNYTQLLEKYDTLNTFYQDYSELQANYTSLLLEHEQNIRSLIYITVATTTIFIIAIAYLSTHAHRKVSKSREIEK